ncbi:hypothetical protein E2R51_12040 [Jeotgalibacillus sp. S-D1]|uniref:hypothetical protein n=1 Tax=Jeotgalibacillus sp. S-D1 TaxID=2552189 RepID=UPI0010596567|nr:hypothetical protein [Jeotgalibacillus sp. S-D1]TDL31942.1 hypothetical protein E2R51_12040 [Jeotgalibacillus sp. S-D1]
MVQFKSFHGIVTSLGDKEGDTCNQFITVVNESGAQVNFVTSPSTYFVDHELVSVGDSVTGYYDASLFVIMIYPQQYGALVMVKNSPYQNVKVDYFDEQLLSSDGLLQLNPSPDTQMLLPNGQVFTKSPVNRYLIVLYSRATTSIPAQAMPYKIIVWCG